MNHPLHGLPISQAAYLAEMLTDYPVSQNELYLEMVKVWPELSYRHFCHVVYRLKGRIRLRVSGRGVWVTKAVQDKIKESMAVERQRVFALVTSNQKARIELKKL